MPTFGTGTRHEIRRLEASKTLGGQIQSLTFVDRAPPGTRFHFSETYYPWGYLLESATNSLLYAGVQKRTVPRYQIGNRSGREYMQQTAITPGTGTIDLVFHPTQVVHREWMNAPINARYMIRSIMAPPYMNMVAGEYDHISASMVALAPEDQSIMSVEFLDSFGAEYVPGVFYRLARIDQINGFSSAIASEELLAETGTRYVQYEMERMANSNAITVGNAVRDLPRDDTPADNPATDTPSIRYGYGGPDQASDETLAEAQSRISLRAGEEFQFGPAKIRLIMKEDHDDGPGQIYIRVGDFSNPSHSTWSGSTIRTRARRVIQTGRDAAYSIPPVRGQFANRTHHNVIAVLHIPGEQGGWAISNDLNAEGKDGWLCSYEYFRGETEFGAGGGAEHYNWIPLTGHSPTTPASGDNVFLRNLLAYPPSQMYLAFYATRTEGLIIPRENSFLF